MITNSKLQTPTIIRDRHKCFAPFLHTKISLRYFANHRATHVPLCVLWRKPSLWSLPTRATGSALCVMGSWLWFLGHVYSSYTCTGSQHFGIWASQGQEPSNELTAQMLLIPYINALGLTTSFFFTESACKPHKHAHVIYIQHLYKYINVCLCPRASNSPLQMSHAGSSPLRFIPHRLPHRTDQHHQPDSSLRPPPHPSVVPASSHPSL